MRITALIAAGCFIASSALAFGQARALVSTSSQAITLPNTPGDEVVLGAVSLGRQRTFAVFNVQATGTIRPDPDLGGAAFQLRFLICDRPDCSGDIKAGARMLESDNSDSNAQLIATKSFGVSSHNSGPVVLNGVQPRHDGELLYLAVALKTLHSPGTQAFTGKLNLLRVDVMP